ncbi:cation diffusion facilitator family transporter [Brevirhabdus pacifica]|nr:cation diffusion facilitator family transporter [Brevirhabdus pacifica]
MHGDDQGGNGRDTSHNPPLPDEVRADLDRASRLEWWTLFWLGTIVIVMGLVMGSSQAMKAAWIEDLLSMAPPAMFLLAQRWERRAPTRRFPYGFQRAGSLAFFLSAAALAAMGGYLVYDAILTLIKQEHPTISSIPLMGQEVWMGWIMMAALLYSVIPPVILGHKKKKLAAKLQDKVLHTDANMNAADWMTGLAGMAGLAGIALGFWWADAVAAGIIGADVLRDGLRNLRISTATLLDGAPRCLDSADIHPDVERIRAALPEGYHLRARETGRYIRIEVTQDQSVDPGEELSRALLDEEHWRLVAVTAPGAEDLCRAIPGVLDPDRDPLRGVAQGGDARQADSDRDG